MRKSSFILVAAMLLSTTTMFANLNGDGDTEKSLSVQISEMLNVNSFSEEHNDHSALVRFTLNADGEIVVLSVDSKKGELESFIKGRLNYQKVQLSNYQEGSIFKVNVRIVG